LQEDWANAVASLRNQIVDYLVEKIQNITVDCSTYTQDYRVVTRDPISDEHFRSFMPGEALVGVYDTAEEKTRYMSLTHCHLTIVLEFYYRPKIGQNASEELNRIMSELQYNVIHDYVQGGHAINTEEEGNQIDIDGIYDKIINGSITFRVTYRHALFDPTVKIN
jgi:hypothetical protein